VQPASAPLPSTTSAKRKRVKESEGTTIKYQLLFGHTIKVINPVNQADLQQTIQLAELIPEVLQESKVTTAVQFFQDEVEEHTVKGLAASNNFSGQHV
jgi:hypothetical protein